MKSKHGPYFILITMFSRFFTSIINIFLIFVFSVLSPSAPANSGVFHPKTFTLDNGMQVVLIENRRVPVVTHMVWYKVGSANESPGETGIAHFLEHLMFKGTMARKPGEFSSIVARNGGQENAFTSADYTAYFQTIAKDRLKIVMEMEADRMTNLVLNEKEVEPERLVVLEERRSRVENRPRGILNEYINSALFLNHPYRNPVIGWEHDIRSLDIQRILAFYKRWYAPNNAILVVAGDITLEELKPLAKEYYGNIPPKPIMPKASAQEPTQRAARLIEYKDKRVRQPVWRRTFLAPTLQWGDASQVYPLEVLSDILGGGVSSRLYGRLVAKEKIAVSSGAYYSSVHKGPGRFAIYASPRGNVSLDNLQDAIENEIARIVDNGVTADEVDRAKTRLLAEAIYARDSLSGGAQTLGAALASGLSIEDVENWPNRISDVTPKSIHDAAISLFNKNHSVTGLLLPEKLE